MSSQPDESMWRLEWNGSLSVGIPEIDAEHKHFIGLVNDLNDAIVGGMDLEVIKKCMQLIVDDAVAHFAHEEALFKEWDYPEAEMHGRSHANILRALRKIMERFERGGAKHEWIEAGMQIRQALVHHLLSEDMKYRDYRLARSAV